MISSTISTIDRCTNEVDQIFANVAGRLGHGLTVFDALHDRLGRISAELAGEGMDATQDALHGVAGNLRAAGDVLPDATEQLQEIARHVGAAAQPLDRLLDHFRLILAVARSARIEAAQVVHGRQDGGFFDEINALVGTLRQTTDTCARDHARLSGLLASAVGTQQEFVARFAPMLAAVADTLDGMMARIGEHRRKTIALMDEAARQSRDVSDAAAGAVVALQCGDSTRQRLEHALAALRLSQDGPDRADPACAGLAGQGRQALAAVLRVLVAGQLRETAEGMAQEMPDVDTALRTLAAEMKGAIELGRTLSGGDAAAGTFLDVLEAKLSEAAELIAECNAARDRVNAVVEALTGFIQQFQDTAAALSETVGTIVLIGVNSGLHANRLGSGGRGLVVIAHELKSVADQIMVEAARLTPVFEMIQASTAVMRERGGGGAVHLRSVEVTTRESVAAMKQSGARLNQIMGELARDSTVFAATVDESLHAFAGAGATRDAIADAADMLGRESDEIPALLDGVDCEAIRRVLAGAVWPTYTIAAERRCHEAVLATWMPPETDGSAEGLAA